MPIPIGRQRKTTFRQFNQEASFKPKAGLVLKPIPPILPGPTITLQPPTFDDRVGGFSWTCTITATTTNPPLAYQWQWGGADQVFQDIATETAASYTAIADVAVAPASATIATSGYYRCRVSDAVGTTFTTFCQFSVNFD